MKLISYNDEGVLILRGNEEILINWSNILNFSTSALIKFKLMKTLCFIFALLGVVLGLLVYDPESMAVSYVLLVIFFICPMTASIVIWMTSVKPYKKEFDENKHTIVFNLNGNVNQKVTCGSLEDTIELFNGMKNAYEISKLKSK